MNSPREMEEWEVPVSEVQDWTTASQIDVFGYENVVSLRERALETSLNERDVMLLACEGEVLRNHSAVTDRVTAWRSNIPVVPNHKPPTHPFDSNRRLLSILNNRPNVATEVPDDAPTLNTGEYIRWYLLTLLGKFRYDDRKASEERELLWRTVQRDPYTEPDDWADFMRSRRDNEVQNHRANRHRLTNTIYDNMASVSPSGLTMMMPNQSYPPPQPHHWHQAYQEASPSPQSPSLALLIE